MPLVKTDDNCEIYFESVGSGAPLVFVSGFFGVADIWQHQVDALAQDFQCITFDNRGYGRSGKPMPDGAYGIDRHVSDLRSVLAASGVVRPATFVGHSMGGNIISALASVEPQLVRSVVSWAPSRPDVG